MSSTLSAPVGVAQMGEMRYNTGVDLIVDRSGGGTPCGLSNSIGGAITMSDHTPRTPTFKVCPACSESKSSAEFYRHSKRSDGLASWCKACMAEYSRAYKQSNQEKIKTQRRALYEANKARNHAQSRAWAAAHPERIAEINRKYYLSNKERVNARARMWDGANRDKVRARVRRRDARRRGAEGTHTADDIARQYEAQQGKCYYCHAKVGESYHVDHVIPLSRGGSNSPENLVIACAPCNTKKHNKLPHEWPQGGRLL